MAGAAYSLDDLNCRSERSLAMKLFSSRTSRPRRSAPLWIVALAACAVSESEPAPADEGADSGFVTPHSADAARAGAHEREAACDCDGIECGVPMGCHVSCGPCGRLDRCDAGTCVASEDRVIDIAVNIHHSCALLESGKLRCWGTYLPVADPTADDVLPGTPVDADIFNDLFLGSMEALVGEGTTGLCVRLTGGEIRCWKPGDDAPTAIEGLAGKPVTLSWASLTHRACALLEHGGLQCWGSDRDGVLGDGPEGDGETRMEPRFVYGFESGIIDVDARGDRHMCAVHADGKAYCWGYADGGRITGNVNASAPKLIEGLPAKAIDIAVRFDFSCTALEDGSVWCWGNNRSHQLGQLGHDQEDEFDVPVPVHGLPNPVVSLTAGRTFVTGHLDTGRLMYWGSGGYRHARESSRDAARYPARMLGIPRDRITKVVSAERHNCMMVPGEAVMCWGDDSVGQIGVRMASDSQSSPVGVVELLR